MYVALHCSVQAIAKPGVARTVSIGCTGSQSGFSSGPRGDITETFTSDGPGSSISAHGA